MACAPASVMPLMSITLFVPAAPSVWKRAVSLKMTWSPATTSVELPTTLALVSFTPL